MNTPNLQDENEYEVALKAEGHLLILMQEHTVYHFDVNPRFLHGALDRFAQFFVAPLCKVDSLEREVEAVENEFTCALQDDYCRALQMLSHTVSTNMRRVLLCLC